MLCYDQHQHSTLYTHTHMHHKRHRRKHRGFPAEQQKTMKPQYVQRSTSKKSYFSPQRLTLLLLRLKFPPHRNQWNKRAAVHASSPRLMSAARERNCGTRTAQAIAPEHLKQGQFLVSQAAYASFQRSRNWHRKRSCRIEREKQTIVKHATHNHT